MKQSQEREKAKWSEHVKKQQPLKVGHIVSIQNLEGNHPLKWYRNGIVVEVKQHDQYNVRVDGSGRITLRKSSLAAPRALAHRLQRRTACNT